MYTDVTLYFTPLLNILQLIASETLFGALSRGWDT